MNFLNRFLRYALKKLVASPGIEPGSGASETLILSPSERRSAGRALYYKIHFFKNLLPAEVLKYFSLTIASSLVTNSSLYINFKGI